MGDSMSFSRCSINAKLNVSTTKNLGDVDSLADPTATLALEYAQSLTDGRGSDNANAAYWWSGTIAAAGSAAFDLAGTLTNAFGDTVNFDLVKYVFVRNTSASASLRLVATSWTNWTSGASDYVLIKPDGFLAFGASGATVYDIAAGSDTITLQNIDGANSATYQIGVVGVEIDSSSSDSSSSSTGSSSSSSASSGSSSSSSSSST